MKSPFEVNGNCAVDATIVSCFMLTVGKTAPFYIDKQFHGRPVNMLANAGYDGDILEGAMRWTGKEPTFHLMLPNLSMGNKATIFLGECYLDKEDPLLFAHAFAKGNSNFDWPDSFAIHQCPFCCKMAQPCKDKSKEESIEEASYIMIIQNIMQYMYSGGRKSIQKIHRGLPRLCCKGCFEKNLIPETESGDYHTYPGILQHGILSNAAKSLVSNQMEQISEGKTIEKFKPSAYSLFGMYKQCGMIAAIDEFIYINQQKELEMIAPMLGLSIGNKPTNMREVNAEKAEGERCHEVD